MTRNETGPREGSRTVSIFLVCVGLVALGASMFMNFRFGYGLSKDFTDRTTLAILHVLTDPAAAGLVVAGTMMRRWGWKREGTAFQVIAGLLILYSMLSVYGFMSARIATTQSHSAVVAMEAGRLDWTQKSSVNRELPKSERRLLRSDAKELAKELRSSLAIIPDAQAASIAAALSIPVEKVQRGLVMISSGIAQALKFVCLLCAVMIWPRRDGLQDQSKRDASATGGGGGKRLRVVSDADDAADATKKIPAKSAMQTASHHDATTQRSAPTALWSGAPKMSPDELYDYLHQHASGQHPPMTQRQLAAVTGWSQPSVCRKLRRQQERADRKAARRQANRNLGHAGYGGSVHAPAWA